MYDRRNTFSLCFRPIQPSSPTRTSGGDSLTAPAIPDSDASPKLTTFVYHTEIGLFSLTWSCNSTIGRSVSLYVQFYNHHCRSVHVQIKPFLFWTKRGCSNVDLNHPTARSAQLVWDLTCAKFGAGPEPRSGYYVALLVEGSIILLIGDHAYARTRAKQMQKPQALLLRREHVTGNERYSTRARFRSKMRTVTIECSIADDQFLRFSVDREIVLEIKQLKWKFRGNGKIEFDGVQFQISWDVYNWIFDEIEGPAVFVFKFDKFRYGIEPEGGDLVIDENVLMNWRSRGYGMNAIERKKMQNEGLLKTTRSSSPSSISSSMSGSGSSVMEWASTEEELEGPLGFSLIVYAWRR